MSDTIKTISICIATYKRPQLLESTLNALLQQHRLPDEVIISDASEDIYSERVVAEMVKMQRDIPVKYVRSPRKALPWQRWLASTYCSSDIVFFLDDDVYLQPETLIILEEAYRTLSLQQSQAVAGIGIIVSWEDGERIIHRSHSWREYILGIVHSLPGTVTDGGICRSHCGLRADYPVQVDYLWGGAMSFPRDILLQIGFLDNLFLLYEQGIGRSEDAILSSYAQQYGALYLITQPLALHPRIGTGTTPYAAHGWRKGLTESYGRAHILRWLSSDWLAYKHDLLRLWIFSIARSLILIVRRPGNNVAWESLGGMIIGILWTILDWQRIPISAKSLTTSKECK